LWVFAFPAKSLQVLLPLAVSLKFLLSVFLDLPWHPLAIIFIFTFLSSFCKYPSGYTWLRFHSKIYPPPPGIGSLVLCPTPILEDQYLSSGLSLLDGLASLRLWRPFSPWFSFRVFLPLAFRFSSPRPQEVGGSVSLLAALTGQVTKPSWRISDF
jgi:hypothetical protein